MIPCGSGGGPVKTACNKDSIVNYAIFVVHRYVVHPDGAGNTFGYQVPNFSSLIPSLTIVSDNSTFDTLAVSSKDRTAEGVVRERVDTYF